jgi:hypothetical protein
MKRENSVSKEKRPETKQSNNWNSNGHVYVHGTSTATCMYKETLFHSTLSLLKTNREWRI